MISVVIPAHNPAPDRLGRTIEALRQQTLPKCDWELVIVDNASNDQEAFHSLELAWHHAARIVCEEKLGLTPARIRGFKEANGGVIVLVDDDNVLAPDYLAIVQRTLAGEPQLGALGGRSVPEFAKPTPSWMREFDGLLALRDLGSEALRASWRKGAPREYPICAPIGAGMAIRREPALAWAKEVAQNEQRKRLDRTGTGLMSGGDNDLILTVLRQGWSVGYTPRLRLTHLIPASRLSSDYLGRLNRAVQKSWVQVLALHGANPWSAVPGWTVPLRVLKAWFTYQAWKAPAARIRWLGARGRFEGLADLPQAIEPS